MFFESLEGQMADTLDGAGKGSDPRPVDRKKWDEAEYWKNLKKRKKAVKTHEKAKRDSKR